MAAVMVSGGGAERFEGLLMNQWMETSFGAAAVKVTTTLEL